MGIKGTLKDGTLFELGFVHTKAPEEREKREAWEKMNRVRYLPQTPKAVTYVRITFEDPEYGQVWSAEGRGICAAMDRFDKEVGRKVAIKMALDNTGLDREDRKRIWEAYFGRR